MSNIADRWLEWKNQQIDNDESPTPAEVPGVGTYMLKVASRTYVYPPHELAAYGGVPIWGEKPDVSWLEDNGVIQVRLVVDY